MWHPASEAKSKNATKQKMNSKEKKQEPVKKGGTFRETESKHSRHRGKNQEKAKGNDRIKGRKAKEESDSKQQTAAKHGPFYRGRGSEGVTVTPPVTKPKEGKITPSKASQIVNVGCNPNNDNNPATPPTGPAAGAQTTVTTTNATSTATPPNLKSVAHTAVKGPDFVGVDGVPKPMFVKKANRSAEKFYEMKTGKRHDVVKGGVFKSASKSRDRAKKKHTNSSSSSINTLKTDVERKKASPQPSDSPRKKSLENPNNGEGGGSKERTARPNNDLIDKFFAQYSEKQKNRRTLRDAVRGGDAKDSNVETMPESSSLNASVREMQKSMRGPKKAKEPPLTENFIRADGVPIWMIHPVPVDDPSDADKEKQKKLTPEQAALYKAMAEDKIVIPEVDWVELGKKALDGTLEAAEVPETEFISDPYREANLDYYNNSVFDTSNIIINTAKTLGAVCEPLILRSHMDKLRGEGRQRQQIQSSVMLPPTTAPARVEKEEMRTAISSAIHFEAKKNVHVSYCRENPKRSISKMMCKMPPYNLGPSPALPQYVQPPPPPQYVQPPPPPQYVQPPPPPQPESNKT